MYLKSIEIQGFKSFANKICFEFHNGITGIVGPNGSGKSNVGDAVRWVLGEQSAKQLRGGNMQDVIFSGTENRKPLGFASVAITLDNSDHKLDIEYEEVTVTRRLYRSGESEYLLNGAACRLKDINELFYDTGIGKEGYSIIGQGQIDKILSGKPEERRELFDEAAGIVKFKRRKNTALKKLADEQQNLVRVNDILSELTRQLGPLSRQSETARIYIRKREELKNFEVSMFLAEMEHSGEQLAQIDEKYRIADDDLKTAAREFEQTKTEYEILEQEMEALDTKIEQTREAAGNSALLTQQLEGQRNVLKEQVNTARLNDEHHQNRADAIESELGRHEEEAGRCLKEKEDLLAEKMKSEQRQKEKEEALKSLQDEIEAVSRKVEDGKGRIIELLNKRASTKGKVQRYDAMLEQIQIRKSELNQRYIQTKSEESQQKELEVTYQTQYEKITAGVEEMSREQKRLEQEVASIQKQLAEQNRQMEVGQTAYHREASRLESLKNLTERYDGYGNSIRRVMEQKQKHPGIRGVVADLIQTDKKYETAVETALGGSIQNIVTDDEHTAKSMIDFLKKNRYGRATFLPLTTVRGGASFPKPEALSEEGVIGLAHTLVKTESRYESLIQYLLGRTLVVDHIDHAITLGKKYRHSLRMVTLEGESFSPGGSMTGGAFKNSSNLLGRRRELEELEHNVKTLKREMYEMQQVIEENRSKRNVLRDTIMEMSERIQEQCIQQNTARMNLEQTREKLTQTESGYAQLKNEQAELSAQIREINESSAAIGRELDDLKVLEECIQQEIFAGQEQADALRRTEEQAAGELETAHLEYAQLKQKEEFLNQTLGRIHREETSLREELTQIRETMNQGSGRMAEIEQRIAKIEQEIEEAAGKTELLEQKTKHYNTEKEKMSRSHKAFFEKRDELSQKMNLLDKECFRLNNQREKLEESREARINYMWEEYEVTPGSAVSLVTGEIPERGDLKKEIAACKEEIRKLGPVNVNAIEDYKELKERHEFLETQHHDLVEAEATLLNIIDELETGMRKQFAEKFEEIRKEFDRVFKQLFGGGKGTLELMDDEDVLEAGIRIISQPPGKKLQNMMQLSGGEKALTAIALLFAIQNLKPSPFCLLDEIEAALDDSNVTRFAQYLHKLTKNTQFIIITHRRGTMTAADRLYGITMQEKGVSTLVSVNLIENDLDK
ncbi:chromosome segregation protein SMC [Ruminococcus gauvreauii]|uniref:chromosome segregation protein SMC n=1 Tax=Ruminococcus gauvreauii TaxID=438033 RepID=UPI0039843C2F